MDDFRAIPKLNEKLGEMVASGEARLATVVASYGNEVDVELTGGAIARFPSTHIGVPVGSSGALIATRGGGRLFIPMGMVYPIRQRSSGLGIPGGNTVSTSGDYPFLNATITFTDLNPDRTYWLEWTIDWLAISATNNGAGRLCAEVTHAGGTTIMAPNTYSHWRDDRRWQTRGDAGSFTPTGNGEIIVRPLFRWDVGTTQFLNSYIRATLS